MTVVLGIDPGTQVTGYALVKGDKALDFGAIRTKPKSPLPSRYLIIYDALCLLVKKYRPDAISIETQFVYKNAASALKIGMARAMALLVGAQNDIPIFEYTPKKAKSAIVGHGGASKEQVQRMLRLRLNLPKDPEPEDAADALALALCHLQQGASHV